MRVVHRISLVLLLVSLSVNLGGCMFMSDSQKTAVDIYTKKRTVDDMFIAAQEGLNSADYMQLSLSNKVAKIDKDKSMTEKIIDGDTWELRAIRSDSSGYWKGIQTRNNEEIKKEEAYCVKNPDESGFEVYRTNDSQETWIKGEASGIWSGLVITSLDYNNLVGVQGLELDKEPQKKDDILQWRIHGNISYDDAIKFLTPMYDSIDYTPDDKLNTTDHVELEFFMDTENRPISLSLKFIPGATSENNLIYESWKVNLLYSNYDAFSTMSVPSSVKLSYITQEQNKEREESFQIGGEVIEIETTAEETSESSEGSEDESQESTSSKE